MKKLLSLRPRIHPLPDGLRANNWKYLLATWGGVGRLRPAPGTLGTIAAMPVGYLISYTAGAFFLFVAAMVLWFFGTHAAQFYGEKSGVTDDQSIVVDEAVGIWIAAIPAATSLPLWALAFVLFRLFDIWKPWPASFFDNRGRNGSDVMLDDVIAGIYAFFGVATVAASMMLAGEI